VVIVDVSTEEDQLTIAKTIAGEVLGRLP